MNFFILYRHVGAYGGQCYPDHGNYRSDISVLSDTTGEYLLVN